MDAILVVNAGSSSVKFQIFGVYEDRGLKRLVKGQMDGIGTLPRLIAKGSGDSQLIDRTYEAPEVPNVGVAMLVVGEWLRTTQQFELMAVGHRVVHGGAKYDRPVIVDQAAVATLEQYVSLAPLHQPNCHRSLALTRPFTAATALLLSAMRFLNASMARASDATASMAFLTNTLRSA
jgi:acetate kinase